MANRSEFLVLARRLHNAFRHAVTDGDGRTDDAWIKSERPLFDHYACGMYLAGTLAFIEGRYGKSAWKGQLDKFVASKPDRQKKNYQNARVSEATCEALVCIRNAVTHNDADLSRNDDKSCLSTVRAAAVPGVSVAGSTVFLSSEPPEDFMNTVRLVFVAISDLKGVT
jgi:hypothetical protein